MNKQKILKDLINLFDKDDNKVAIDENTIIVGIENYKKNRDKVAETIAKKFKSTAKNRVIKVGEITILVKPKSSVLKKQNKTKIPYAFLQDFLKTHDTSSFSKICDPVAQKTLPKTIKEESDVYAITSLNTIIKKKIESEYKQDMGTTIVLAGETYTNVICCVPIIRGDEPKADFCLVCIKGKSLVPKGFFSYKKDKFGGYSGVSKKAGLPIHNHPEVKKFIQALKEHVDVGNIWTDNSKTTLKIEPYRVIKDEKLKKLAVFGPDADKSARGVNSCDAIVQGTPKLSGNSIKFDYEHNRKSRTFPEGYVPVLGARKDSKRNLHYGDIIIEKMRVGIFHDAYRPKWKNRDKESQI